MQTPFGKQKSAITSIVTSSNKEFVSGEDSSWLGKLNSTFGFIIF